MITHNYGETIFIQRNIKPFILELLESFKIVTIAGPRQSGKTTLREG